MDRKPENTIFKNIFAVFLILIMHVLLVVGIGVLILFFYGLTNHIVWVILGVLSMASFGYWFYRRMRSDVKDLKNIAGDSLKGKNVEVSFLGGMATFKISDSPVTKQINIDAPVRPLQLTAPGPDNVKTLTKLAELYEKELITLDEYNEAKKKILK